VCRIWWESDLVDHQTKDIVVEVCEIFLINPTNIAACCSKALAKNVCALDWLLTECLCMPSTIIHALNKDDQMKLHYALHEDATHVIKIYTFYNKFHWFQHCYKMFTMPQYHYLEGFNMIFWNFGIFSYQLFWQAEPQYL